MNLTEEKIVEIVNDNAFELDEISKQKLTAALHSINRGQYANAIELIVVVINRCNWKFELRELRTYLNTKRSNLK